jgi:hypothetical protein
MTSPRQQARADTIVCEHLVHAFFPLSFGSTDQASRPTKLLEAWAKRVEALSVAGLSAQLGWEPDDAHTLQNPAWVAMEAGRSLALGDFYGHMRQIVGKQDDDPGVCRSFALNTPLLSRFKNDRNRVQKRLLSITLGEAAAARCGFASMTACIDDARLFAFRTGIAILDLSWHYEVEGPLSIGCVLEGNYLLSHDNHPGHNKHDVAPDRLDPARLHDIALALLPAELRGRGLLHLDRRILYSMVRLDTPVDADTARVLATWLSHRQTTDYHPPAALEGEGLWQPFPYLCHASAPEGGASVIFDAGQTSGFVQNFVKGSGNNTYIPLFVSSLHNHFWLLNQTDWIPAHRRKAGGRAETEELERLYEQTVEFRRYFYFPMVSQISLHNTFYEHWQDTLHIAQRLRFVEQTARDVAELIKTRRTRWLGRVSGAVAGFLLTHEILELLSTTGLSGSIPDLRVWLAILPHAPPPVLENMIALVERWEMVIFFGSVAGALVGLWLSWNFGAQDKKE